MRCTEPDAKYGETNYAQSPSFKKGKRRTTRKHTATFKRPEYERAGNGLAPKSAANNRGRRDPFSCVARNAEGGASAPDLRAGKWCSCAEVQSAGRIFFLSEGWELLFVRWAVTSFLRLNQSPFILVFHQLMVCCWGSKSKRDCKLAHRYAGVERDSERASLWTERVCGKRKIFFYMKTCKTCYNLGTWITYSFFFSHFRYCQGTLDGLVGDDRSVLIIIWWLIV